MRRKRFLRTQRLPMLAALTVALAAVGLTAFVASAGADFTTGIGTSLKLTNGSTTGTPPSSGSWVELLSKTTGAPFLNPATTAASLAYTLINGSGVEGLLFGTSQSGGIFGPLTYFQEKTPIDLFSALTLPGSDPLLTFSGSDSATGAHALLAGNLSGLDIVYAGNLYRVGTLVGPGPDIVQPLSGLLDGNALSGTATVTLHWETALLENGFEGFNALFHWVGVLKNLKVK
jgi:hypothetical protein